MAEAKPLAADVKAFKGFIAIDGTTHNTKKLAIDHSTAVKIKAAVTELAETIFATHQNAVNDVGPLLQFGAPEELAAVLIKNRTPLLKAFDQQVRLRAPGAGRKPAKKAAPAPTEVTA